MAVIQALCLALVQGLTEFLPISSSAHLILVPILADWPVQGIAFDVSVHVGTLLAVSIYFRQDLVRLARAWLGSFRGERSPEARLAWGVILGTIPVGLVGLLLHDVVDEHLRSREVIAAATIVFGLLLGLADRLSRARREESDASLTSLLIIGLAQALALIPGTSRSGATITAALCLGFTRSAAARISFLLSIPVIVLAGGYESLKLIRSEDAVDWRAMAIGVAVSAISAYLSIDAFLRLVGRIGMMPFVIYRLVLGAGLIAWILQTET